MMNQPIHRAAVLVWLMALASFSFAQPPAPSQDEVLASLREDHPRLMVRPGGFDQLKQRVERDKQLREMYGQIRDDADDLLDEEPAEYRIPDGKRLLGTSRRVLRRVYTLALVYRIEGQRKYLDRARAELEQAAGFKDWNPSHFLDTAEMTHALAVGYDWLHDDLTEPQRRTIRESIVKLGLTPGLKSYRGEAGYGWWTNARHNWNQVCNAGLAMGALAIADKEPEVAREILHHALKSVRKAMRQFAPEGAYLEGVSYWGYGVRYNVYLLDALQSALGTDFDYSDHPGFDTTGLFPVYMTGPTGRAFNYADMGGTRFSRCAPMRWLGRRFDLPACHWYADRYGRVTVRDLLWYDGPGKSPLTLDLPKHRYWKRLEAVTMRTHWANPNAAFVGFKAGSPYVNHGHADLGSFVLDGQGQRWAVDLGSDDYNMPRYFSRGDPNGRWRYYRLRAEGHNTLVINPDGGPDQKIRAETKITRHEFHKDRAMAVADLTPAYADDAESVKRTVRVSSGRFAASVIVGDEIETKAPAEVWWFMHTRADVELAEDGRSATLKQGGETLSVELSSPSEARFTVRKAEPLPTSPDPQMQAANKGVRKLAIHLQEVTETHIKVTFATGADAAEASE